MTKRTFTHARAVRSAVPLLVGLCGPSKSGKTFSALRLATGMQRIVGGDIFVIDSEANRAKHYADDFDFQHVEFTAPFGPLDYLAVIQHCVDAGARIVVVDSMSHEHEGPGGVLEMHAAEVERLSKAWKVSADKTQMPAWGEPKSQRRRLLNTIVQLGINLIFCFRAKEKIRIITGKPPVPRGWVPIAGDEFIYETTVAMLLPAMAEGVPEWSPEHVDERIMIGLPKQFAWLKEHRSALDEAVGERMAQWAAGDDTSDEELVAEIGAAATESELVALAPKLRAGRDAPMLRAAYGVRLKELRAAAAPSTAPAEAEPPAEDTYQDQGPPDDWEPGERPSE